MQRITLLGATGSVGHSTLDLVRQHPDRYQIYCLAGHRNVNRLAELITEFNPEVAVVADGEAASELAQKIDAGRLKQLEILHGPDALCQVSAADSVDTVVAAIVGSAGLAPNLAAVKAGKKVLLANKESLVSAGGLFMDAVASSGATLLPVDSEHNAIFQCLPQPFDFKDAKQGLVNILLTASGGPFRTTPMNKLVGVTPDEACAHPNWSMGRKISVDSATLMNKGLELIEACWLFGVGPDKVEVVVHPESVIHSMVRYQDGSVIAQLGSPDMRTPIAYGLAWPERIDAGVAPLDFTQLAGLHFEAPDEVRFPNLRLAREAFLAGGTAPAILNAANEISVQRFLNGQIGFLDIARINEQVMTRLPHETVDSIEHIFAVDQQARLVAQAEE